MRINSPRQSLHSPSSPAIFFPCPHLLLPSCVPRADPYANALLSSGLRYSEAFQGTLGPDGYSRRIIRLYAFYFPGWTSHWLKHASHLSEIGFCRSFTFKPESSSPISCLQSSLYQVAFELGFI